MDKNFESKRRVISIILVLVALVVIVCMAIFVLGNKNKTVENVETSEGNKVNTSIDVTKDKKVGDIILEKNTLIYQNGVSKLTSKAINNGADVDNLRFKVKFIANDGTVIAESVAYVGPIKNGETRLIVSDITLDVLSAKEIVYEIVQ